MPRPVTLLASLVALLPLAAPARAATWEQGPSHAQAFGIDGLRTADDFSFATRTEIRYVKWWGGYLDPFPPTPATDDHFTVQFYLDEGGLPGQPIARPIVEGRVRRELTGAEVVPPGTYGIAVPEYVYFVELVEPFPADAGTTYWISIENASQRLWLWEASAATSRPGLARSPGGFPWSPDGPNAAFLVADTIVPPCAPASGLQPPSRLGAYGSYDGSVLADDFVLPHGGTPTKLIWWGANLPDPWWEQNPGFFRIDFYADAGGRPGGLLFADTEDSTFTVNRVPTGCTVSDPFWGFDGQPEYRYEAVSRFAMSSFPAFEAGRKYWMSVRTHQGWGWAFSSAPQTPGLQVTGDEVNWFPIPESAAFDLEIEPVAAPGACSFPTKVQMPTRERALVSEMGGWLTADDFVSPGAGNLTRIEWWGGYPVTPFPGFAPAESFTVLLYADDAGRPGAMLASWDGPTVIRTPTGEPLQAGRAEPEYHYAFDLPASLPVEAGRRYWLSVSNWYFPLAWSWGAAAGSGGRGLSYGLSGGSGPWLRYAPFEPQNAAFRLAIEPVSCGPIDGDGDGVEDHEDADPGNPLVCRDTDGDSCDDCASGTFAPASDGPDTDGDAACDAGDADDDNDGRFDTADNCPLVFNPLQEDRDADGIGSVCDGPHTLACTGGEQAPAHASVFLSGAFGLTGADDFVVERDSHLTRLAWWGGFESGPTGEEVPIETFTIRIYGDTDGRPGALLHAFNPDPTAVQRQATADPLKDTPPPPPIEYRYTLPLPQPLPLAAGRYWLAISAVEHPVHIWGWSTSSDVVDAPAMVGTPDFDPHPTVWSRWQGVDSFAFTAVLSGGACVADRDGDGIVDGEDDPDVDLDGVSDGVDNCPAVPNPSQSDLDGDGLGSACDGPHTPTCTAGPEQPPARTQFHWSDGIFTIADNVALARDASVLRLQWWGGSFSGEARLVERFTVRLYDDAAGVPGLVRHTWRPRRVAKDATGDLLSDFLPVPEYRYTFELPLPVALPPATYWVSIVGQLPTPDPWLWSISEAAGLPGLVANTSATPDQGPWEAAPLGDNVALSVTVAGEACAADTDADGVLDGEDVSPGDPLLCIDADADLCDDCSSGARNPAVDGPDLDGDGSCDLGDTDDDADAVPDDADNCPVLANPSQVDFDGDGAGDECDPDDDEDGVADAADSCPLVANPTQADFDGDGAGDECDPDDDGDTVADAADRCAASVIPETSVPTAGLVEGRYALVTGDGAFDTVGGAGERFTIAQTRGCTCAQVLTLSPGEKEGHYKHGCSADLLRAFITGP